MEGWFRGPGHGHGSKRQQHAPMRGRPPPGPARTSWRCAAGSSRTLNTAAAESSTRDSLLMMWVRCESEARSRCVLIAKCAATAPKLVRSYGSASRLYRQPVPFLGRQPLSGIESVVADAGRKKSFAERRCTQSPKIRDRSRNIE